MTTTPEARTGVESELAARLKELAHTFVAQLEDQGRLVEAGGAGVLQNLRRQIEARRSPSDSFQAAVDTIAEDCGYPGPVAVRIATALQHKGILAPGEASAEPKPSAVAAPVRGMAVFTRGRTAAAPAPAVTPVQAVERVEGQTPQIRPAAAVPPAAAPTPAPTPAPAPAAAWEEQRGNAIRLAADLGRRHQHRLEVMAITPDQERVTIAIKATALEDWEYWLEAIGAPRNVVTRTVGYAQVAAGRIDGVDVHLTAHDVPRFLHEASKAALDPFYLWGRIYDLGAAHVDAGRRVWLFLGQRHDDGMPLLVLRGSNEPPYPLASVVMHFGPLTPVDPTLAPAAPVAPVAAAPTVPESDEGGEER